MRQSALQSLPTARKIRCLQNKTYDHMLIIFAEDSRQPKVFVRTLGLLK